MKKTLHRSLSLLLALVMALTLAVPAWAVEPDEEAGLSLSKTRAFLPVGGTLTLTAELPAQDGEQTPPEIQWTSSDPTVATVSPEGEVTALALGQTSITASCGEDSAVCAVTVEKNYVVDVSISPLSPGTLFEGGSLNLSAHVTYKYAAEAEGAVVWSSSDSSVATVSPDGKVSALSEGKVVLSATAVDKSRDGAPVTDVYKLTVRPSSGEGDEDLMVLTPTVQDVTGISYVPMVLHAPGVAVVNGQNDLTDHFTFSYQWTSGEKAFPGGETMTFLPSASCDVTCHITAVSNTDSTRILTADWVYSVQVVSGVAAEGSAAYDGGSVPVITLIGGTAELSVLSQLQKQIPGLVSLTFDLTSIIGDDVGSLIVQANTDYTIDAAGEHPLSDLLFSPIQPGEYSIGFIAHGDEDQNGRLKITVTGNSTQTPTDDPATLLCYSEGVTLDTALTAILPSEDPIVTAVFGTPRHGLLLRDFAFGSGTPDNGSWYYTSNAASGDYPVTSLTYVPRAGFSGLDYLPVTFLTQSGTAVQSTLTFTVISRNDSDFFEDVTRQDVGPWSADSTDFASVNGLMNGMEPKRFFPNETMSRAMLITVLYRMEGSPAAPDDNPYRDVDPAAYYGSAVRWASANGIVKGDDLGNFRPNDPLTREQLAVMLHRYADFKGQHTDSSFSLTTFKDAASISDYAKSGMSWAVEMGIITGVAADTLSPQGSATRAQVAVMLHRFLTL